MSIIKSPIKNPKLRGNDKHGSGAFGAPRGARKHRGVDIVSTPGESVFSPMDGKISKIGFPYGDGVGGVHDATPFRYVEITGAGATARVYYVEPTVSVGQKVKAGDIIGTAQDLDPRYSGITRHVHLEVRAIIDPTPLVFGV